MNRKGFTLVEIIVVIAVLSVLTLVLVPNIFVMINKNNEKSCNNLINNIESSAKLYVNSNKYELGFGCDEVGNTKNITLQQLVQSGDLKLDSTGKIINPVSNTEISLSSIIKVTYDCNSQTFSYEMTGIDCTNN